mgnify:FL=1|jgi:hypothetical protein
MLTKNTKIYQRDPLMRIGLNTFFSVMLDYVPVGCDSSSFIFFVGVPNILLKPLEERSPKALSLNLLSIEPFVSSSELC